MTPFWPDVGEAGRCFVEKREADVGGSEQFRNRLFDLQNTETVGERGDPIGDEHATGIWPRPPPRGANLSRTNQSRGRLHFRSNDRAPLSSDITFDNRLADHSRKVCNKCPYDLSSISNLILVIGFSLSFRRNIANRWTRSSPFFL